MHKTRLVQKSYKHAQDQAGYENFQRYSLNTRTRLVCSKLDTYQTNHSQRHAGESIFLEASRVTWLLQGTQAYLQNSKLLAKHNGTPKGK
jgi:hypothetical protein